MRQRLPAGSPLVVLALALAAVVAYVLTYALDTTAFLNDEFGTVIGGRTVARDPMELLTADSGVFARGLERLTALVLAIPDAVFGAGPAEMRAGHVVLAVAYALVALPAYALLRGLGVAGWPASALAFAAVVGPWVVFGATLLNVTLAAPLTVLFVWLTWRAVVRPSVAAEALAVGAAGAMTTARASHATFFAAAVLAAVATAWWERPPSLRLARFPLWVAHRTPVLTAVTLLGAMAVLVFGTDTLAGRDYAGAARIHFPLEQIWNALGWTTAVLAIATGFLPLTIGGAWALRQAARPTDLAAGAFAVIALATFLAYVYLMGASGAQEQERYPAVLAALPVVAMGAALFRREAWALGTVAVGLLAARAIATRAIEENAEPLNYFFSPAQLFFSKVVLGRLRVALPGDEHMVTIATLGAVALAAAVAVLCARRAVTWAAVAAVVALGTVAGVYTLRKYEPATAPGDLDAAAFLDVAGGGDETVFWNYQWAANAADRDVRTRSTIYHNSSACCGEWRPDPTSFVLAGGRLDRDPAPRLVGGFDGYRPVVFAATDVARPVAFGQPMRVERFTSDPPLAAAVVRGAGEDGAVERRAAIEAQPALRGMCLDVQVTNRAEAPAAAGFAVGPERGRLEPGGERWVRLRGGAEVRRTGGGEAVLVLGEIRYVDCDAPPA
ncbi:MAG TPA: hypothetical protein VF529_12075 [Solirubrobacteraceae bacterium]